MGHTLWLLRLGLGAFLAFFIFVRGKVFGLFAQKPLRLIGKILAGLDGFFPRKIEWRLAGKRFESHQPVL
jgi:hypothetical protein